MYVLYILRCSDGTLYTGITTDLKRRIVEHNSSPRGARYTRSRRPVRLVYQRPLRTRVTASRAEYRLKRMSRVEKTRLIKHPRSWI